MLRHFVKESCKNIIWLAATVYYAVEALHDMCKSLFDD